MYYIEHNISAGQTSLVQVYMFPNNKSQITIVLITVDVVTHISKSGGNERAKQTKYSKIKRVYVACFTNRGVYSNRQWGSKIPATS